MESLYEFNPSDIPSISGIEEAHDEKICPGLQRFCPHYTSTVCDVKYSECVLLNSLETSETLLRAEREKLIKDPTPQNLAFIAQINEVLHDKNPDTSIDPAAIIWHRRKGRLVAALFFLFIVGAAVFIYMG